MKIYTQTVTCCAECRDYECKISPPGCGPFTAIHPDCKLPALGETKEEER